ncbi:MAG: YdcF family protein, partial [Lachnospiraceae bacterium]|nr:YdcF family protein [Lachnospiraceae bacterium]
KMVLEDQAKTTRDNFRNTAGILEPDVPVVLISSNYHMDRAVQTARSAGFTHIIRRPAPSSFRLYGANVMWEAVMELNELTLKR